MLTLNEKRQRHRGSVGFQTETYVSDYELQSLLKAHESVPMAGHYASAYETETHIVIKQDYTGSFPVFYRINESSVDVSHIIHPDHALLNSKQKYTFRWMGFCSGSDTFRTDWKQVLAGQKVSIDKQTGEVSIERQWKKNRAYHTFEDDQHALVEATQSIRNMWARWWPYLKTKSLMIPLSGGYDSRLLLALAVESGHPDIHCYSYGSESSFEVKTARHVAEKLAVEHTVLSLDADVWNSFDSAYIQDFIMQAHTGMATPQLIEAVTIELLKRRCDLGPDTLILPGHSGDLLGGSHLPSQELLKKDSFSRADIVAEICRHHGRLIPPSKLERDVITTQIEAQFEDTKYSKNEFVDALEYWNLQNRQSKFILNTGRAYEGLGLTWATPLWDADLAEFWYGVPLEYRANNTLYNRCVNTAFFEPFDLAIPMHEPVTQNPALCMVKACLPKVYQSVRHMSKSALRNTVDYNATQPLNDLLQLKLSPKLKWHQKEDHACLTEWVVQQFYS